MEHLIKHIGIKMNGYIELVFIPTLNASVIAYSTVPSLTLIEGFFKVLLLAATFIFTVVKIYFLIKNNSNKHKGEKQ